MSEKERQLLMSQRVINKRRAIKQRGHEAMYKTYTKMKRLRAPTIDIGNCEKKNTKVKSPTFKKEIYI